MSRLKKVEALMGQCSTSSDRWVLHPHPIPSLSRPERRKEWEQVIEKTRINLVHEKWDEALTAVRELSDVGGVQQVVLLRVRMALHENSTWKDGKKL